VESVRKLFKNKNYIIFKKIVFLGKPSRVIHIRNIPNEASDAEVINLGLQFGRVTNVLVLKGKNQAFLEMADEISATAMVSVFNTTPPSIRGRTVYVQFSNHRELKTDQNHSITVSSIEFYLFVRIF
jgi:RNA recognition motif-containing protein